MYAVSVILVIVIRIQESCFLRIRLLVCQHVCLKITI